jgi:hypothetical protein
LALAPTLQLWPDKQLNKAVLYIGARDDHAAATIERADLPKRMIHPDFAPTPAMISELFALDHDMTIRLSHHHDSSLADDKSCWTLCNFNGQDLALPPSSRFVSPKMKPSQSARHRFVFSLRTSQS